MVLEVVEEWNDSKWALEEEEEEEEVDGVNEYREEMEERSGVTEISLT